MHYTNQRMGLIPTIKEKPVSCFPLGSIITWCDYWVPQINRDSRIFYSIQMILDSST